MSDHNDYSIPAHLDPAQSSTQTDSSNNAVPAPQPAPSNTADPVHLPESLDHNALLDNSSVDVPHIDSGLAHDFGDFDPSLYGTGFDDFNGDNRMYGLDFDGIELPLADQYN